jgi:class 3 adenylate cyclase
MPGLPAGTVTFLFTDIEGSTTILGRQPVTYRTAVQRHHDLLQGAVEAHGGTIFETVGDAVYAAFPRPTDAAGAALQGQLTLQQEPWGESGTLRVRMGLHLGEVELRGEHYFGLPLYRCSLWGPSPWATPTQPGREDTCGRPSPSCGRAATAGGRPTPWA